MESVFAGAEKTLPIFVMTAELKGELNHRIFLVQFFLFAGSLYRTKFSVVLEYPLTFNAFSSHHW